MGSQRLGAKKVRRIEALTGETVLRAWGHGGYVMDFVTAEHYHGQWDTKTGAITWQQPGEKWCYNTCDELPPIKYMLRAC